MLRSGWGLVWRRQRLLWWIYVVSVALAFFAVQPLVTTFGPILNNSLAADRLYHTFDLATFGELLARPDVSTPVLSVPPLLFALIFLVLMLLFTGGILKVYNEDRTFSTGEFFGAGGRFFWRFVRLLILLLIVLIPVALIRKGFMAASDSLSDRLAAPAPGVVVRIAGMLVVLFLLMAVRLWFDMAEVRAVAEDEYAIRRSFARAFRLTWNNFGSLFWIYFWPSLLTWLGTVLAFGLWVEVVPHAAVGVSVVFGQAVIFLWILTRLWQRASETLWYQRYVRAPAVFVTPAPLPEEPMMVAPVPATPSGEFPL